MEVGNKGSDDARPTYWLDACEEDSDLVKLRVENANDDGIFQMQVEDPMVVDCRIEVRNPLNGFNVGSDHETNGSMFVGNGDHINLFCDSPKVNGAPKVGTLSEGFEDDRHRYSQEMSCKRVHNSNGSRDERSNSNWLQGCNRNFGVNGRKRGRECERDRDRNSGGRRRDYYNERRDSRDREWREREAKGYWERERQGSNAIVYRQGLYEVDRNKDASKNEFKKNQACNGRLEKNVVNYKEKNLEEQARQYQLDVLEQAKQRNTIAFLETGAGKTLIAVLLIKSISQRLRQQNRKMLAIFLVPKVPLVYQVH